jgi:hypothetical protein
MSIILHDKSNLLQNLFGEVRYKIIVSLGPQGILITGMKTEPIVKLTSETHSVNLSLDEMGCICFYTRLLSLD